jgi:hypothetical protein
MMCRRSPLIYSFMSGGEGGEGGESDDPSLSNPTLSLLLQSYTDNHSKKHRRLVGQKLLSTFAISKIFKNIWSPSKTNEVLFSEVEFIQECRPLIPEESVDVFNEIVDHHADDLDSWVDYLKKVRLRVLNGIKNAGGMFGFGKTDNVEKKAALLQLLGDAEIGFAGSELWSHGTDLLELFLQQQEFMWRLEESLTAILWHL